jgi:hypothetical protein
MSRGDHYARRRLRNANPLKSEEAPPAASPRGQALFQHITHSSLAKTNQPFWRRRRALLVLVPAVALAIGAGYALLNRASDPLIVACFREPSLSADRALVSLQGDDLLSACQPLWERGGQFNSRGSPPPALTACILAGGELAVFPELKDADTCAALGLQQTTGEELGEEHRAIQAVKEELFPQFLGACHTQEEATALVERSLRGHGLTEWHVEAAGQFTGDRPCATLAFDFPRRVVTLVPTSSERST